MRAEKNATEPKNFHFLGIQNRILVASLVRRIISINAYRILPGGISPGCVTCKYVQITLFGCVWNQFFIAYHEKLPGVFYQTFDVRLCDMQITSYLLCLAVFDIAYVMKKFWDFTKNLILKIAWGMTSGCDLLCLAVFAWMKTYLGFYQKSHLCRVGKIRLCMTCK